MSTTMTTVINGRDSVQRNADLPRSCSYTFVPSLAPNQDYNRKRPVPITIKGSFSEDDLIAQGGESLDISPPESSGWTTPNEDQKSHADSAHDLVAELHKSPKISIARCAPNSDDDAVAPYSDPYFKDGSSSGGDSAKGLPDAAVTAAPTAPTASTDRLQTSSFAKRLSRKLSYSPTASSSRSPSPSKRKSWIRSDDSSKDAAPTPPAVGSLPPASRRKTVLRKRESVYESGETKPKETRPGLLSRRSTMLRRKSHKAPKGSEEPAVRASLEMAKSAPAVPQLPKSFSTDRLPYSHGQHDRPMPVPRLVSGEKIASLGPLSLPRKRDELWSVFRSLDGDYTKFQSKSSALKANVVRASLLPFLRNYADHPSSFALRAEDLDRRANILNKWWTALLEMLHGKNNQSISGTDRPAILDGIAGIMDRPEWRLSPSPFCPLTRRNMGNMTPRTKSSTSLASSGTDFLTESVHHNVRNMFVQNLNSQMAFVVDRMSLRNASASLVTFCGKATAYAFFFCPGIAEVLVRLWDTPTDNMRRVLEGNGVGKFENLEDTSARIISAFPPAVQQLGFCSLGKTLKHLRTQIALPLGTANIQWYGYWLERWLGRESDLFYAFVKNFHILVTDYVQPDTTKKERMCIPGLLLVHAQILANLDSTIHRDAGQSQGDGSAGLTTIFDDILADPDAVASTLPAPPTNAIRVMAENRLIMLIRDFLSDRSVEHPRARQLFAESFNDLLQACARRISVYDHAACYTLCDFLEEALLILVRYEHTSSADGPLINSKFWLEVCKKMISSHNTMTEIRLFAFLYTVWPTIAGDSERRADLCLGLLLDEDIFAKTFNHWCPMVRAYFMRLLCWRVGRFDGDGEASPQTRLILETLLGRLQSVWSHYLWMKEDANNTQVLLPSTIPCNPAPGRRLLIIRTDTQMSSGSSFLAFDGIIPPHAALSGPGVVRKRHTTLSPVVELDSRPTSSNSSDTTHEPERERGIRGFLRTVMGGSKERSKSRGPPPSSSAAATRASNRLSMVSMVSTTSVASAPTPSTTVLSRAATDLPLSGTTTPTPPVPRHRNFSFKFSLEFQSKQHVLGPMRLVPPRLPMPAQSYVQSQSAEVNSPLYMSHAVQPQGEAKSYARYAGRALAEWTVIVMESQSFFERRKNEGVPNNKYVETPTLAVEVITKKTG